MTDHAETNGPAPDLSVIICAHNPRRDYLDRTLEALRRQTLPAERWELLIVDNASETPLADTLDLTWKPGARVVTETELGLTHARLRGIGAARGETFVFVDDDNVLDDDYLETALRLFDEMPFIGVVGGSSIGEFETEPPAWTHPYLPKLCIRKVERLLWTNNPEDWSIAPSGAGMCVRAEIARAYAARARASGTRSMLGRKGQSLMSGEDIDLVLLAPEMGLGFCRSPELSLRHLIPANRYSTGYLRRMVFAKEYTVEVLLTIQGKTRRPPRLDQMARAFLRTYFQQGYAHARMEWERQSGRRAALAALASGELSKDIAI